MKEIILKSGKWQVNDFKFLRDFNGNKDELKQVACEGCASGSFIYYLHEKRNVMYQDFIPYY